MTKTQTRYGTLQEDRRDVIHDNKTYEIKTLQEDRPGMIETQQEDRPGMRHNKKTKEVPV